MENQNKPQKETITEINISKDYLAKLLAYKAHAIANIDIDTADLTETEAVDILAFNLTEKFLREIDRKAFYDLLSSEDRIRAMARETFIKAGKEQNTEPNHDIIAVATQGYYLGYFESNGTEITEVDKIRAVATLTLQETEFKQEIIERFETINSDTEKPLEDKLTLIAMLGYLSGYRDYKINTLIGE